LWWGTYRAGNFLSQLEGRLALRSIYDETWYFPLSFGSTALLLIAGVLYIRIIRRISAYQTAAAGSRGLSNPPPWPAV
jgi:hypothetical protein